jgi:ubiquinone/menaquinone biosynthesis C-methylase UbiE
MWNILTDKEWATRHVYDENWIEGYWKSRDHPHRTFLAEKIGEFSQVRNILEIGCASGPNLYNIARKFPDADLRGIDINPMAVQKGNEWLRQDGISNVKLEVGRVQELAQFADKSFDVVFTDAVLIYISPREIEEAVKEILRISRAVVLCEWQLFSVWLALLFNAYYCLRLKSEAFKFKSSSHGFFVGHWVRDYRILFKEFVPQENICISKIPKEMWDDKGWQTWGAIIEMVNK